MKNTGSMNGDENFFEKERKIGIQQERQERNQNGNLEYSRNDRE